MSKKRRNRSPRIPSRNNHTTIQRSEQRTIIHKESYRGPIPSADELAKYEASYPGGAKIFFTILEKQNEQRINVENRLVDMDDRFEKASIRKETRGQWLGFLIAFILPLFALGGSFWLISIERHAIGNPTLIVSILATLFSSVSVVVKLFLVGNKKQQ